MAAAPSTGITGELRKKRFRNLGELASKFEYLFR
jgi:hypothetical protein